MKTIRFVLPLFLLLLAAPFTRAADGASVHAILITASNEKGDTDRRLAQYEPTLKRILRFESFRFVGEGSADLPAAGEGSISLGRGHRLELEAEESGRRGVRVKVRWIAGGTRVMDTGLSLQPGVPAVLGGPETGKSGEVFAILVIGR